MKKLLCCVFLLLSVSAVRAESTGEILTFPANPEKGFHWGYALYLPKDMDTSKKLPLLLTMTNEDVEDSVAKLEEETIRQLRRNYSQYGIADGAGVPMLVPLILQAHSPLHTHQLNRAVFTLQDGPFAHLDEQVLAMLSDARSKLKERGVRTQKKFLLAGFSTPGVFAWHFAMLQPEHVLAAVVGGHQHLMLPLAAYNNIPLIYPIGTYDFELYTGKVFNRKAWQKIPILVVNGGDDYNDPLPYDHVYSDEERAVFKQLYGEVNLQQIWRKAQEILAPLAPNIQFHTYPHLGHETIWEDEIEFLKKNIHGGRLSAITPTDTSARPALLPIRIKAVYVGQQAPIEQDREYLNDTDLLLQTDKDAPYWVRYKNACQWDVVCGRQEILSNLNCRGIFDTDKGYSFLQITLSDEEFVHLKKPTGCSFSLRSHYSEILTIPADLTFTVH